MRTWGCVGGGGAAIAAFRPFPQYGRYGTHMQRYATDQRLSLADLIAETWKRYTGNLPQLLALGCVPGAVTAVLYYLLVERVPELLRGGLEERITPDQSAELLQRSGPFLALIFVASTFLFLAVTAGSLAFLRDKDQGVSAILRRAAVTLPVGAVFMFAISFILTATAITILLLPVGLFIVAGWAFALHIKIDQGIGIFSAIGRSNALVRRRRLRVLGVSISLLLLGFLGQTVLGAIGNIGGTRVGAALMQGISLMLVYPFVGVGLSVLYLDILRHEARG